ncbi:MAG: hypothetical protein R2747_19170 [Pyrinomonadaceae bacterium]
MDYKGVLKRAVPFILTFTVGLLIAGLFISISAPSFRGKRNWKKHREYHRRLESENYRLRVENCRMRKQMAEMERQKRTEEILELKRLDLDVPPPPPLPPAPREVPAETR